MYDIKYWSNQTPTSAAAPLALCSLFLLTLYHKYLWIFLIYSLQILSILIVTYRNVGPLDRLFSTHNLQPKGLVAEYAYASLPYLYRDSVHTDPYLYNRSYISSLLLRQSAIQTQRLIRTQGQLSLSSAQRSQLCRQNIYNSCPIRDALTSPQQLHSKRCFVR